jgi:hypothetical protein
MEANTPVNGVTIKEMERAHLHGLTTPNIQVLLEMI